MKHRATLFRSLVALAIFTPIVVGGALLAACAGIEWFPDCKKPGSKCPPVEPEYPPGAPFSSTRDASTDSPR